MNLTLYLFKHCDLIEIKHFKTFTDMTIYLLNKLGRVTCIKMEQFYDKHHVFLADGYIGVLANYKEKG